MILKIPKADLRQLTRLALLPNESTYLMRAVREAESLKYLNTPILFRGDTYNTPPVIVAPNFSDVLNESKEKGYFLIEGHTHPQVEGELIAPYNYGWTLPRTKELRDYRNKRLNRTPEGRKTLEQREKLLESIIREEDPKIKEELQKQLIDTLPETATANLITLNGIHFYITNRADIYDMYALKEDVNLQGGDFKDNYGRINLLGIEAIALVHAHPKHVLTPSSTDKFILSVLKLKGSGYEDIEKIPVEITQ